MSGMPEERNAAVLVGNGLSIAFSPKLKLESITEAVLEKIRKAQGNEAVKAMQMIAEHALPHGATSANDFELLVGAFGAEARTLGLLETLAHHAQPDDNDLGPAIKKVADFAQNVRTIGVSYVLETIAEHSHATRTRRPPLDALVAAILEEFPDRVTFGNLNYDTLLLALLVDKWGGQLVDLAQSSKTVPVEISTGTTIVPALRNNLDDLPSERRVRLFHLHGSLTFWESEKSKTYAKLSVGDVRGPDQWERMRLGATELRPVVVLANQRDKREQLEHFPFNLAYQGFRAGLEESHHWIVIGYSFRDEALNDELRAAFLSRTLADKPRVVVVTFGDDPNREDVERAFGWGAEDADSSSWLAINREGAVGFQDTDDWRDFAKG